MYAPRYFPVRQFTPRYFPPGAGDTGIIRVSISDSVGLGDNLFTSGTFIRTLDDSVGFTDTVSGLVVLIRTVQDTVGVSDSVSKVADYRRVAVDILTPQDVVNRVYTGRIAFVDTVGLSDQVLKGQARSLLDSVGLSDAARTARILSRSIQDQLATLDDSDKVIDAIIQLANQLGLTDEAIANLQSVSRLFEDQVGITDSVNAGFLITLLLQDQVGIADKVIAFLRKTDVPCFVDLTVDVQSEIVQASTSNGPFIRTTSGILIPDVSSVGIVDPSIDNVEEQSSAEITGRKIKGSCDDD
jgi:hypothetical protein